MIISHGHPLSAKGLRSDKTISCQCESHRDCEVQITWPLMLSDIVHTSSSHCSPPKIVVLVLIKISVVLSLFQVMHSQYCTFIIYQISSNAKVRGYQALDFFSEDGWAASASLLAPRELEELCWLDFSLRCSSIWARCVMDESCDFHSTFVSGGKARTRFIVSLREASVKIGCLSADHQLT